MAAKRTDAAGHLLAAWNMHPTCRACLANLGIVCTRDEPCHVCDSWEEAHWILREAAIKRRKHQEAAAAKAASIRVSLPGSVGGPGQWLCLPAGTR